MILSEKDFITPLALDFLKATLSLKRNILVTGPQVLSLKLFTALTRDPEKPAFDFSDEYGDEPGEGELAAEAEAKAKNAAATEVKKRGKGKKGKKAAYVAQVPEFSPFDFATDPRANRSLAEEEALVQNYALMELDDRFAKEFDTAIKERSVTQKIDAGMEMVNEFMFSSGVYGWLEAGRLDRALMRFEILLEKTLGYACTPLHILAALDLVVVLDRHHFEIAEICLHDKGYRPQILFNSALEPTTGLVALPSFMKDLKREEYSELLTSLQQSLQQSQNYVTSKMPVTPTAPYTGKQPAAAPFTRAAKIKQILNEEDDFASRGLETSDLIASLMDDLPPAAPSLNNLKEPTPSRAGESDTDAAMMSSIYGLEPPPLPKELQHMDIKNMDLRTNKTFNEVLKQVRTGQLTKDNINDFKMNENYPHIIDDEDEEDPF